MELLENPFYLLGAHEFTQRRELSTLVEQQSLILDEDICQDIRSTLLTPRKRLSAEVSWVFALPVGLKPYIPNNIHADELSKLLGFCSELKDCLDLAQQLKDSLQSTDLSIRTGARNSAGADPSAQQAQAVHQEKMAQARQQGEWSEQLAQSAFTGRADQSAQNRDSEVIAGVGALKFDSLQDHLASISSLDSYEQAKVNFFISSSTFSYQQLQDWEKNTLREQLEEKVWLLFERLHLVANDYGALSKVNLLCMLLEIDPFYPRDLRPTIKSQDYILQLILALEKVDVHKVLTVINQARRLAGVSFVSEMGALEDELVERKHQIIHKILDKLSRLSHVEQSQYLCQLIYQLKRYDQDILKGSQIVKDIMSLYSMQSRELFSFKLKLVDRAYMRELHQLPAKQYGATTNILQCEQPFVALKMAWMQDWEPWRVEGCYLRLVSFSRAWMQRIKPVVDWALCNEQDLTEIEALDTLFKLWLGLFQELVKHQHCLKSHTIEVLYQGLELFQHYEPYYTNLDLVALDFFNGSGPLMLNQCLRKGRALFSTTIVDPVRGETDVPISVYQTMLQVERTQVSLSDVATMHFDFDSVEDIEFVVLKDYTNQELISVPFVEDHQSFVHFVEKLSEALYLCKFAEKYEITKLIGRPVQLGRLSVTSKEVVLAQLGDFETEKVFDLRVGKLVAIDGVTLGYARFFDPIETKDSSMCFVDDEDAPEGFVPCHEPTPIATFEEIDNLPIFLNFLNNRVYSVPQTLSILNT